MFKYSKLLYMLWNSMNPNKQNQALLCKLITYGEALFVTSLLHYSRDNKLLLSA